MAGNDGSVAGLGEWGVIAALRARMPAGPLTSVGIGDDAAVVGAPSGSVVAAVDMVIEGRHFLLNWSSAYDIGVKAAARSLADIAAMGAVNTALLVALATPGTLPARWAADLADGLAAEATRAGAGIAGGDTARADSITLAVTALGDLAGRPPVLRSGARPGDVIAVAGLLGHSAAGLALLMSGAMTPSSPPAADQALPGLVTAHLRPAPLYQAGPEAAVLGATAMIDVSDGLISDLGHIATASGVHINIATPSLPIPSALLKAAETVLATTYAPGAPATADPSAPAAGTRDPADVTRDTADRLATTDTADPFAAAATALDWVLTGGEDHALVAAFPPSVQLPPRWRVIGEVREGAGVTVDNAPHAGPGGWQHFR